MQNLGEQMNSLKQELRSIERDLGRIFFQQSLARWKLGDGDFEPNESMLEPPPNHQKYTNEEMTKRVPSSEKSFHCHDVPSSRFISRTSLALVAIAICLYYIMLFATYPKIIITWSVLNWKVYYYSYANTKICFVKRSNENMKLNLINWLSNICHKIQCIFLGYQRVQHRVPPMVGARFQMMMDCRMRILDL